MIRDGNLPGGNITIFEATPLLGGSLDGTGNSAQGYSMRSDRPLPVPQGSKNLALISQFVEIAEDVVFTVEYSARGADGRL